MHLRCLLMRTLVACEHQTEDMALPHPSSPERQIGPSTSHLFQPLSLSPLSWFIYHSSMSCPLILYFYVPSPQDRTGSSVALSSGLTLSSRDPAALLKQCTHSPAPSLPPSVLWTTSVPSQADGCIQRTAVQNSSSFHSSLFILNKVSAVLILKHLKYTYVHRTNSAWLALWINERCVTCLTITRKPVTAVIPLWIYGANDLFK